MKTKKSNLDERQEQKLLEIESHGFWLAFWGLAAALVVEQILYGWDFEHKIAEWIIFMIIALYLVIACVKNGIWDRRLKMNVKTNLIVSLIAGVGLGVVNFAAVFSRYPDSLLGSVSAAVMSGAAAFVLCFVALGIAASATKKKQKETEEEPEDTMTID